MTDIRDVINRLANAERGMDEIRFLAPRAGGGKIRLRLNGIIQTFSASPPDFEGWGIFRATAPGMAQFERNAESDEVERYLQLFPEFRLRLVCPLTWEAWLAYPVNESDAQQRLRRCRPEVVRLTEGGRRFESIVARHDGAAFWFGSIDRRADPEPGEKLEEAFRTERGPSEVKFAHLTPEMLTAYRIAFDREVANMKRWQHVRDEKRLKQALWTGGGRLRGYRDKGDFWQVEWETRDGHRHTSAIGKNDLTVLGAGICLAGGDRQFDLQSLVTVVERRDY